MGSPEEIRRIRASRIIGPRDGYGSRLSPVDDPRIRPAGNRPVSANVFERIEKILNDVEGRELTPEEQEILAISRDCAQRCQAAAKLKAALEEPPLARGVKIKY